MGTTSNLSLGSYVMVTHGEQGMVNKIWFFNGEISLVYQKLGVPLFSCLAEFSLFWWEHGNIIT